MYISPVNIKFKECYGKFTGFMGKFPVTWYFTHSINVKFLPGIGVQVSGEYTRMEHKVAC